MVTSLGESLDAAARIASQIAANAISDAGRCTWVREQSVNQSGRWTTEARTLDASLASGTAGIGWLLAVLGQITGEGRLERRAVEALRASIDRADALVGGGRIGFYDGALGVAWAAIDAGRALRNEELQSAGRDIAGRATAAYRKSSNPASPWLIDGEAGVAVGLLAVAGVVADQSVIAIAEPAIRRLERQAASLLQHALRGGPPHSVTGASLVGMAHGASGIGFALASYAGATGDSKSFESALSAFCAERVWCVPPDGWRGAPGHLLLDPPSTMGSWCSGSAGVGAARLAAYAIRPERFLLAELGAAIDVVHRAVAAPSAAGVSLCHGIAGWIDMLVTAALDLNEPTHMNAARIIGSRFLRTIDAPGFGSDPTLLFGNAGLALALARLDDPTIPGPALWGRKTASPLDSRDGALD